MEVPPATILPDASGNGYFVFEVTRVVPAHEQPLPQVEASILQELAGPPSPAAGDSASTFQAKWSARTSCQPGYVVQGCRQF